MSKSFVYVLEGAGSTGYVKIGKANDVSIRILRIGRDLFNCNTIKAIECKNSRQAQALESYLHSVFEEIHSPKNTREDGWSEWFRVEQAVVLDYSRRMGHKIISVPNIVIPVESLHVLLYNGKARGEYPLGVSWHNQRDKFFSRIKIKGGYKSLGLFETPYLAHLAWQKEKIKMIEAEIGKYDTLSELLLETALSKIKEDIENETVTSKKHYYTNIDSILTEPV